MTKPTRPIPKDCVDKPPMPCDFKPGDAVIFRNDYGVEFALNVVGFVSAIPKDGYKGWIYLDSDSWWFPTFPEKLRHAPKPAEPPAPDPRWGSW